MYVIHLYNLTESLFKYNRKDSLQSVKKKMT